MVSYKRGYVEGDASAWSEIEKNDWGLAAKIKFLEQKLSE